MENPFLTLQNPVSHQVAVKDSLFIAYGSRADSPEDAMEFLRTVLKRHADASHLCWAYKIGEAEYRYSDAGEPSGTAGQPIMRAIEGAGLRHVVVGVARYFGGTKLGAGGLVRAYGGAAAEVLRAAEKIRETPRELLEISVGFDYTSTLFRLLDLHRAERVSERYGESGITLRISLPAGQYEQLCSVLRDATRGQFSCVRLPSE